MKPNFATALSFFAALAFFAASPFAAHAQEGGMDEAKEAVGNEAVDDIIVPQPDGTENDTDANSTAAPQPVHALAMHGTPKYGPDFAHFDYVNPEAPKGGTLRLGAIGSFNSLNPYVLRGDPAPGIGLIYETLTEHSLDEPFTEYGRLAESIEVAPDRSWVAFNLRPEARWHDGEPLTAEDVVFSLNLLKTEAHPFYRAYYGDVTEAVAENDHRVKFIFAGSGNAELPLIMGQLPVLPQHYWEGREFDAVTLDPPLGSGPYRIGAIDAGRALTYERVQDYWGEDLPVNVGQNNFDAITYSFYRDTTVAREALFAGEYDFRQENTAKDWVTAYDAPAVEDGRIAKEEVPHGNAAGMQGFVFNTRRDIFSDPVVRQALAYVFDFEWSNRQFAYNSYTRTQSFFENSELASSGLPEGRELEILEPYRGQIPEEVFTTEYAPPVTDGSGNIRDNLATAFRLLSEAGWHVQGSGSERVLTGPNGEEMDFEILLVSPAFERWVGPFKQNLERLGARVSVRLVDAAQYQARVDARDFDMIIGTFGQSLSPGNEQRDFWGSEAATLDGSRNYSGISDPVIDELIEGLITASSREDLIAYTRALDRVLLWNHIVIPQWHIDRHRIAYWKHLRHPENLPPYGLGVTNIWWSAEAENDGE